MAVVGRRELEELLRQTAPHHHTAYAESDGADPEWPIWYAAYLQSHLIARFGGSPSRSLLVHLLVAADRAQTHDADVTVDWVGRTAELLLAEAQDLQHDASGS